MNTVLLAIKSSLKGQYATWDDIFAHLNANPSTSVDENALKVALNDLKAQGLINFPDRGRNARTRYELTDNTEPVQTAPTPIQTAPTPIQTTPVEVNTLQVLPLLPEARPLDPNEGYGGDNYFSRVAMNMTPCFGGWSPRAKTCDGCPLRHECRNAAIAELHTMAARWSPTTIEAPPAIVEPVKVAYPTVRAPFDVICVGCSSAITSGSDMVYDPPGKNQGCYHEGCC
jgi:hypothetical protein